MFTGRVNDHTEYYRMMNQLQMDFYQISDAAFSCHSRNRFPFNRIFAVKSAGPERSVLYSHSSGKHFNMEPGCIYFMTCGTDLEFDFQPDTKFFAFHFNVMFGERDLFSGCDFLERKTGRQEIIRQIESLLSEKSPDFTNIARMQSLLFLMIADFLKGIKPHSDDEEFWKPVLAWIQKKADAAATVEELASILQLSHDTFTRKFVKEFHIAPKRYLEMETARKAAALLMTSSKSLSQIAKDLHFSEVYYFCRFFRKMTGIPPGQYRKQTSRMT